MRVFSSQPRVKTSDLAFGPTAWSCASNASARLQLAWMPACAGMTEAEGASLTTNVIPAKAGIHAWFGSITETRRARRSSQEARDAA